MSTSIYSQMIDAIAAAGIATDQAAMEYGYSEGYDSIEPIVEIDFTEYAEHSESLNVSDYEYFHSLALAYEARKDLFDARSQSVKAGKARAKVQTHLNAQAAAGLRPATTTKLFK